MPGFEQRSSPDRTALGPSSSEDEEQADMPTQSRKRARLSTGTEITSPESDPAPKSDEIRVRKTPLGNRGQTHQPGSIVRVKLVNFVTYAHVEFFPGPRLNMVIGPNGTGKSTLVCAICLGLGWGPQHLGRAKDISQFVKHGAEEAIIEIELAKDGKRFKKNVIFTCIIKREGNKCTFAINGKSSSKKSVKELARSLSIQIDNLCQFLPQDKVVEFAAMTPVELLHSTQRAVASNEMIEIHEQLKVFRRQQKTLQVKVGTDEDTLANLEGRQRLAEVDVERIREREKLVKRVELLNCMKPTVRYREAKATYLDAKENRKRVNKELIELEKEVEPALRAVNAKERYASQIKKANEERTMIVKKAETQTEKVGKRFEALELEYKGVQKLIDDDKKAAQKRRNESNALEGKVGQLQSNLSSQPPVTDLGDYNEKIRAQRRAAEEAENSVSGLRRKEYDIVQRGRAKYGQMQSKKQAISELDSQAGLRLRKLRSLGPDTAKLWEWLQENRNEFEQDVFGPPMIECNIPDTRYVDMVESLFQRTMMLAFTVQSKNDFAKLSSVAHEQLGLSDIQIKTMSFGLDQFQSSLLSREKLQSLGFDAWAIDLMEGPAPIKAMLCGENRFHETAVGLKDISSAQYEQVKDTALTSWVTRKSSYRIARRREYGDSAVSTAIRQIMPAKIWTEQAIDTGDKQQLLQDLRSLEDDKQGLEAEAADIKKSIVEGLRLYEAAMGEAKSLAHEKSELQRQISEHKAIPMKISGIERRIEEHRTYLAGVRERLEEHGLKQDQIALDRAGEAIKFAQTVEALRVAHNGLHETELMLIEAKSEVATLQERNTSVKTTLENKRKEVKEANDALEKIHTQSRAVLEEVQALFRRDDAQEIREFVQTQNPDQSLADLEAEIEAETARLDLMHEGSNDTVRIFEARKKEIEKLASKLADCKHALEELNTSITTLRGKWEPELDRIVERISASFGDNMSQINCAGEVGIHKDDDFEQWAIQIRVKFREHEPLNILTSHRQSGGERAVSTIFYLMSLQSLTPSPFRVVDEINQGMDPRNERLVHRRMVEIACGSGTIVENEDVPATEIIVNNDKGGSQYFLITPKLLPDLNYAHGMQVMCIASGEYMPEQAQRVDFRQCVQQIQALKRGQRGPLGGLAEN